MKKIKAITIIGIMAISLGVHLWGMRKDLPYSARFSDTLFSSLAVKMASTGDPNPHWFGNPGSTVIYPLAVIYHVHHCLFEGGRFFHANPGITLKGDVTDAKYIYIGRLWTILFGVLTVPFIYLLGRDVFGSRIGLVGAFLYSFYPLAVSFAQTLRTDSPATFLGVLAVWLMIRLYTKPSFKNQILAGIAIGLAVSTRYFMATLIPILLLVDVFIFIRAGKEKQSVPWDQFLAGIAVSGFAFALTTPFFILDFSQALSSIRYEARSTHLGADGLSPFGNLIFYFKIIFQELRWPQTVFLLLGTVFAYRH